MAIVTMSSQVYFSHWPNEGRVDIEYGTLRSWAARRWPFVAAPAAGAGPSRGRRLKKPIVALLLIEMLNTGERLSDTNGWKQVTMYDA